MAVFNQSLYCIVLYLFKQLNRHSLLKEIPRTIKKKGKKSFVFDMALSEEPDRKRARFSKVDGDILAKLRIDMSRSQRGPKEVRAVIRRV